MTDEELDAALDDLVTSPKRVQGDNGNSVEQQSIQDLIALDRYRRSKEAANAGLGIRMTKLVPPGAD